jgi:hypothetical protein
VPGPNPSDDRADVTVVIPAHDRAHVLPRALASVHGQTLRPAEIIVVDDGSSDETAAVAQQSGVTVLRHDRARGAGEARNTGICSATTRWIAFLDSDDEWAPHHLATLIPRMGRHALLTSVLVDTFGRARGNTTGRDRPITPGMLFFPENVVCTSTVVADRAALVDAGLFRTMDRAEDLDLWVRLLRHGTGYALAVPTGTYHVDESYVAHGLHRRNRAGTTAVLRRYEGEQWMTRRLRWNVESQGHWDDFRHALHRGNRRAAAGSLGGLLRTPTALPSVVATMQHRRRGRSAAWSQRSGGSDRPVPLTGQ